MYIVCVWSVTCTGYVFGVYMYRVCVCVLFRPLVTIHLPIVTSLVSLSIVSCRPTYLRVGVEDGEDHGLHVLLGLLLLLLLLITRHGRCRQEKTRVRTGCSQQGLGQAVLNTG